MEQETSRHQNGAMLASATKSTIYGIVIQAVFRLLTFVLNAVIVRFISSGDLLGVVNVRLLLLYTTVYVLTTEPYVRACPTRTVNQRFAQTINVLWRWWRFGLFWSVVCAYIWMYLLEQPNPSRVPYYHLAVVCYILSVLIELLSLPLYVVSQQLFLVKARAVIEGVALIFQCTVNVTLTIFYPEFGLRTFAVGQLLYSTVITIGYFGYFAAFVCPSNRSQDFPFRSIRDLLPSVLQDKPLVSSELSGLVRSFVLQTVFKQILTKGEEYVMTVFGFLEFANQGIFNVVSNLGSMVVRIAFLPMEENLYQYMSQSVLRGIDFRQQPKEAANLVGRVLQGAIQVRVFMGLTIATFGYSYAALALGLIYGDNFAKDSGATLLRWISFYIFLVSINGVTEGFKNASMTEDQVKRNTLLMLGFSIVHICSSLGLMKFFGSVGLILANCFNMILRILHSADYLHHYFKGEIHRPVQSHLPSMSVFFSFFATFLITARSEASFCCDRGWSSALLHISIGAICLLLNVVVFLFTEHSLISFIRQQWRDLRQHREKLH